MVAWTAKHALMLETIWPLPCEVSVPAGGRELESAGNLDSVYQERRGSRTLFQDDNRRCLAAERHI
jgi:hypothetical protein